MTREEKLEKIKLLEEKKRREDAEKIDASKLTRQEANELYAQVMGEKNIPALRKLCRTDLFFLLTQVCKRRDIDKEWLFQRCREVQAAPDGYLDLWARDHYKSTIITFAKSIQDILIDPNTTIGIFSHTRPIAKGFLGQIKRELEENEFLKSLFPEILYSKPQSEAPKWSLDEGIIVKRTQNPKEATIEAAGLVDGQPTSRHYAIRVYDDTVTVESVSTPEQIKKTTAAWEMSQNLGSQGGKMRGIGTRYHLFDTYDEIMRRGSLTPRIHRATDADGNPVLLSPEVLAIKRRDMGPYTFGSQMNQDPVADKSMSFRPEWRRTYETLGDIKRWNKYIVVDPASQKKKTSDYTVMEVIALAPDGNYYLLDALRDRLNLTQRASKLFDLHRKWNPRKVGYERYGMQADIEHIKYEMEIRNYRFDIVELGGSMPKEDRIKQLIPIYEQGRMYTPKRLQYVDYEGSVKDYIEVFDREELLAFPVCSHDDMLDDRARILDPVLGAEFPKAEVKQQPVYDNYAGGSTGWMG